LHSANDAKTAIVLGEASKSIVSSLPDVILREVGKTVASAYRRLRLPIVVSIVRTIWEPVPA